MPAIELKLELVEQVTRTSLNKDGENQERTFARFKARDTTEGIDWTLTLSVEDNFPVSYRQVIGEDNGTEIFVILRSATKQEKLKEP
jgi:hypothetical protein